MDIKFPDSIDNISIGVTIEVRDYASIITSKDFTIPISSEEYGTTTQSAGEFGTFYTESLISDITTEDDGNRYGRVVGIFTLDLSPEYAAFIGSVAQKREIAYGLDIGENLEYNSDGQITSQKNPSYTFSLGRGSSSAGSTGVGCSYTIVDEAYFRYAYNEDTEEYDKLYMSARNRWTNYIKIVLYTNFSDALLIDHSGSLIVYNGDYVVNGKPGSYSSILGGPAQ